MSNYMIKTIALLTTLLLPIATLAQDCANNDNKCIITKKQTDSLKETDIKPLEATPISLAPNGFSSKTQPEAVATPTTVVPPFEIPTPGVATETKSNLNTTASNNYATAKQEESGSSTGTKNQDTTTAPTPQPINIYR